MKSLFLFLSSVCLLSIVFAQKPGTSGRIVFEEKIKFEIHFGGDMPPMMDSLPKERKSEKILQFTTTASLYEKAPDKAEDMQMEGPEGGMRIMMMEPDDIVYTDLAEMKTIEQKDFMSRMFLISAELKRHEWKLTGKQKTIAGYPCQEAINTDTAKNIRVWFSPMIPVSTGPAGFGNLPGMILEMNFDEGERIITAKFIEIKDIDPKIMVKPKKGKKVSRDEYKAIVDEKMKESGAEEGGGGHQMIIRIQR